MRLPPGFYEKRSFAAHDLRQATLDGCSFKMCNFRGADLRGASLRGSSFSGCDLRDADLRDADLRDARLDHVNTHDPSYGRTDVTGARWDGARLDRLVHERVIGWPFDDHDIRTIAGADSP